MGMDTPDEDYFRFIPLGGLDEVGMNCALVECNGSMLMIDCGYTFPEGEDYGIDYIIPDWSFVLDHIDRLDGVLITHGHQDHIGALPFFLQEVDVPLYSGHLTLSLLEDQLDEHGLANDVTMFGVDTNEVLELGPFTIEFVHVNHSVPNARAISLETPLGRFLFTGDWKMDQTPRYEPVMDFQSFAEFGRDGTLALFGDSTNAQVDGLSTSEQTVYENIGGVLETAEGRVIVAQFSSNLYRLLGLFELAYENDRQVLLLGRSLRDKFQLGREEGFIDLPDDDLVLKPHEANQLPDERLLVISTGSQAEPRASLTRMGHGDHHHISIGETDTIIISARVIPGNERGIQHMVDNLSRRGATVIQADDEPIHGSGHACAEELKMMMNLTQPEYLVPVHGHYAMRQEHAALGREVGVPNRLVIEDGDVLQFTDDGADVVDRIETGRVIVDGENVGDLEDIEIRDRAKLAQSGIVVAFIIVDKGSGQLAANPELIQRGFLGEDEAHLTENAADAARSAINQLSKEARRDVAEVKEAVRDGVRQFFRKKIDRKPVVIPIIHEM